jgi:hypothetical protein
VATWRTESDCDERRYLDECEAETGSSGGGDVGDDVDDDVIA